MSAVAARWQFIILVYACCAKTVPAEPLDDTLLYAPQGAVAGVVGSTLANAEQAYCRSILNYSQVKGVFGEEVMERVALGSQRAGKWQAITLSSRPQGIDGLYVRMDRSGYPRALLVGEAKYGTSRLGITKDGRQLSTAWTAPRLLVEARRYIDAGRAPAIGLKPRPWQFASNPDLVRVSLPSGQSGVFWRESKSSPWVYDGPARTLENAQKAALRLGLFIEANARGKISYRTRAFRIDVTRNTISVKLQEAKPLMTHGVRLKEIAKININDASRRFYMAGVKEEIARQLMKKNPIVAENEAKMIASTATRRMTQLSAVLSQQNRPYWMSAVSDVGKSAMVGGAMVGVLDVASQLFTTGNIDWQQSAELSIIGAASAGAGAAAHHAIINAAINNAVFQQFCEQSANAVGLPTGMATANLIGQGVGGSIGTAVFALGMWLSGNMSDSDAARCVSAGVTGSAIGSVAGAGVIALASAYGTAGTGAAISGLSGAAANSAALAWLGGGSAAAGGGGAGLGAAVVGGVVVVAAVAVTAAIYWGYSEYDNRVVDNRNLLTAGRLLGDADFIKSLCKRTWYPPSIEMEPAN